MQNRNHHGWERIQTRGRVEPLDTYKPARAPLSSSTTFPGYDDLHVAGQTLQGDALINL